MQERLPAAWNQANTLKYVRDVVHCVLNMPLGDEERILDEDGSSLQKAESIRNLFIRDICQDRKGAARHISQHFVYENPTIARLAQQLLGVINISPAATTAKLREMEAMVSALSVHFPEHRPNKDHNPLDSPGEVILLTGTTGALGSQLLASLTISPEVAHVYALNRASPDSGKSLRTRQIEAFVERGLDLSVIDCPKVTLVEGDASAEGFAVDKTLYREICGNITLVIHTAWKVNHRSRLESFKPNLRSIRTLINVALESPRRNPPRIIFTSSMAVLKNWNGEEGLPLEAPITDPELAVGSGYAESKLVAERILENAAQCTALHPVIVRIGQLTGTRNGAWNCGDWVPTFVKAGEEVGALPARGERIGWLPMELAAKVIFEFRHTECQHLHLSHPNPAAWSEVFEVFSARLKIPIVDWDEWMGRLEGNKAGQRVLALQGHYGAWFYPTSSKNRDAPGIPRMDLHEALRSSPTLSDPLLPQINRHDAEAWIRHWRKTKFLSNEDAKL